MDDLIRRQDVLDIIMGDGLYCDTYDDKEYSAERIKSIPTADLSEYCDKLWKTAEPRLSEGDKEVIRIHLGAIKETLCNQRRWEEAQEYEGIIERLNGLPTAEPRKGRWEYNDYGGLGNWHCTACGEICICNGVEDYCPNCGARMEGENG